MCSITFCSLSLCLLVTLFIPLSFYFTLCLFLYQSLPLYVSFSFCLFLSLYYLCTVRGSFALLFSRLALELSHFLCIYCILMFLIVDHFFVSLNLTWYQNSFYIFTNTSVPFSFFTFRTSLSHYTHYTHVSLSVSWYKIPVSFLTSSRSLSKISQSF